jgi:hypothetical protein
MDPSKYLNKGLQPLDRRPPFAGFAGFFLLWCLLYPLHEMGYIYISKTWGTILMFLGFAIPYAYLEHRARSRSSSLGSPPSDSW